MTCKHVSIPFLIVFSVPLLSQPAYEIPFASSGNLLELTVSNSSTLATSKVTVAAKDVPTWFTISPTSINFDRMAPNEDALASFSFSIEKSAPVNRPQTLTFVISNSQAEQWTKEIRITVNAPEQFELFQNYPNPFNPSTTIAYQLATPGRVNLRIFDMLGREVAMLADEEQPAGYHETSFDASRLSSGIYIYQLTATEDHANRYSFRKKMLLVK